MSTLLRYDLTTDPFPLQASPETGDLVTATLTIVASNPNQDPDGHPITLQYLSIVIPVGQDGTDLTTDDAIDAEPPPGWNPPDKVLSPGKAKYVFHPIEGEGQVKGAGLNFVLNNITLNRQTGTAEIDVIEGSKLETRQQFYLTKFPDGWGEVLFWVDTPLIEPGNAVTLHWAGPALADYSIVFYTPQTGDVHTIPKPGDTPLSNQGQYPSATDPPLNLEQDTTFYLTVEKTFESRKYRVQQQMHITVEATAPKIKLFKGRILVTEGSASPVSMVLQWDTQNATSCKVTGDAHLLTTSSLDDGYEVVPSLKKPLQPNYVITADNIVGSTAAPPAIVQWGQTLNSTFAGGNGIAISTDDTSLYVIGGPAGLVVRFDLAALTAGSVTSIVQYQPPDDDGFLNDQALSSPIGLGLAPGSELLYVIDANGGIFSLDATTLKLTTANAPGMRPGAIAVAPDGSRIYIAGWLPTIINGIMVFTPSAQRGSLNFDDGSPRTPYEAVPQVIAISPADGRLFVGQNATDYVTIWEPTNDQFGLKQVGVFAAVQFSPKGIAFSPDGARIFVVGDGNQLHVYDYATLQPLSAVTLSLNATAIACTRDGTRVLVTDGQSIAVVVPSGVGGGVGG